MLRDPLCHGRAARGAVGSGHCLDFAGISSRYPPAITTTDRSRSDTSCWKMNDLSQH